MAARMIGSIVLVAFMLELMLELENLGVSGEGERLGCQIRLIDKVEIQG